MYDTRSQWYGPYTWYIAMHVAVVATTTSSNGNGGTQTKSNRKQTSTLVGATDGRANKVPRTYILVSDNWYFLIFYLTRRKMHRTCSSPTWIEYPLLYCTYNSAAVYTSLSSVQSRWTYEVLTFPSWKLLLKLSSLSQVCYEHVLGIVCAWSIPGMYRTYK